jgi:ParB-like chromosome segregation protein Spo0J
MSSAPANTTLEMRSITALRPYAGNARTHSKKQIKQIAASMARFGFTNPVLISDDGEIIAGHGRFSAAKLLGQQAVPVLRLREAATRLLYPNTGRRL